jgi:hypothetical protein
MEGAESWGTCWVWEVRGRGRQEVERTEQEVERTEQEMEKEGQEERRENETVKTEKGDKYENTRFEVNF